MIGEQTVTCRYKSAGPQDTDIEIQMTIQLQSPDSDPLGRIGIEMPYTRIFPEELEDNLHQRLRNGVHAGIALSSFSLLPDNLVVRILEINVSPPPQNIIDAKMNLGYLLEATISGVVETLLRSMENLRSGKESYYEG